MIELRDGHLMDFACAAGALGYAGEGYFWEWPLRWCGLIRPDEITVISKTLTYFPTRGNLRWYAPWRCVRPLGGGSFVNAIGLTNPGYRWWIERMAPWARDQRHKVVVSIAPGTPGEACEMVEAVGRCPAVVGVQLNGSCPNVAQPSLEGKSLWLRQVLEAVRPVAAAAGLPVGLKLGPTDPIAEWCGTLSGLVHWFEVVNSLKWKVYSTRPSPLARYGLEGGVSGPAIRWHARAALELAVASTDRPVATGGAIDSIDEVAYRLVRGARAFVIGSLYLSRPWRPRAIVRGVRESGILGRSPS